MEIDVIEIVAAVIGFIYLLLEYKASSWLWYFGIITPLFYIYEFFCNGVYANMAINIYYVGASIYGWLAWKGFLKKESDTDFSIRSMPKKYLFPITVVTLFLIFSISILLYQTHSSVWFLDGISTGLSIVGMWMLAKKYYQQWIFWILVEPIIIVISIQTGMYATAVLYFIYTIVAVMGYFKWKKEAKVQSESIES